MKILVTGSRDWKDKGLVFSTLTYFHEMNEITEIIEGCARGADTCAELWAKEYLPKEALKHYPAKWDELGKAAGPIRNSQMLIEGKPDLVIAFHDDLGRSAGTGDMVKKAERAHLIVYKIKHEPVEIEAD